MLLFRAGSRVHLHAETAGRFVLVGGDPFPEPRHLYWNFVSSSTERIEQAKRDWRERRGDPDGPVPAGARRRRRVHPAALDRV